MALVLANRNLTNGGNYILSGQNATFYQTQSTRCATDNIVKAYNASTMSGLQVYKFTAGSNANQIVTYKSFTPTTVGPTGVTFNIEIASSDNGMPIYLKCGRDFQGYYYRAGNNLPYVWLDNYNGELFNLSGASSNNIIYLNNGTDVFFGKAETPILLDYDEYLGYLIGEAYNGTILGTISASTPVSSNYTLEVSPLLKVRSDSSRRTDIKLTHYIDNNFGQVDDEQSKVAATHLKLTLNNGNLSFSSSNNLMVVNSSNITRSDNGQIRHYQGTLYVDKLGFNAN